MAVSCQTHLQQLKQIRSSGKAIIFQLESYRRWFYGMHEAINVRVTEHLLQQNLLGATRSEEHLKTQSNVLKEQKLYKADKKNEITTLETENEILKRRIIESNQEVFGKSQQITELTNIIADLRPYINGTIFPISQNEQSKEAPLSSLRSSACKDSLQNRNRNGQVEVSIFSNQDSTVACALEVITQVSENDLSMSHYSAIEDYHRQFGFDEQSESIKQELSTQQTDDVLDALNVLKNYQGSAINCKSQVLPVNRHSQLSPKCLYIGPRKCLFSGKKPLQQMTLNNNHKQLQQKQFQEKQSHQKQLQKKQLQVVRQNQKQKQCKGKVQRPNESLTRKSIQAFRKSKMSYNTHLKHQMSPLLYDFDSRNQPVRQMNENINTSNRPVQTSLTSYYESTGTIHHTDLIKPHRNTVCDNINGTNFTKVLGRYETVNINNPNTNNNPNINNKPRNSNPRIPQGNRPVSFSQQTSPRSPQLPNLEDQMWQLKNLMMEIQSRLVATTSTFKHKVSESLYRIQFSDNVVYEGGINRQTNIPYGYGKLMLKDEAVYQGEWRNGLFHGWGKLVLRMFHKKGQLERKSVEEVTGNFTDGILNGPATLVFVNGNRFMGVIKNGIIESEGTLTSEKGISIGTWSCSSLVASL